jgi:HTH-type transcriptional regulator / antitoxin HipB
MNKEKIRKSKTFDELLDNKYGKIGEKKRDTFEEKAQYFVISEMLKEARKDANMTQEQLADKVGTKKSYISRLENGKCDIQLSTLYRIFEFGLGKRINLLFG